MQARPRCRAAGFPDAAAQGRAAAGADAGRDRGQHHHLHRRRPRNHGARARLDALLPRQSPHGSATGSSRRSTRCWRASPIRRNGSTAMPHVRASFDEALQALSAGAVDQPRADRGGFLDVEGALDIPKHRRRSGHALDVHRHRKLYWDRPDAFMPERFHPGNRDKIRPLPVSAVWRRAARLHRRQLRHAGGDHRAWRHAVALPLRHHAETKPWPVQRLTTQPRGGLPMKVSVR
jgi:hypothetical protein